MIVMVKTAVDDIL